VKIDENAEESLWVERNFIHPLVFQRTIADPWTTQEKFLQKLKKWGYFLGMWSLAIVLLLMNLYFVQVQNLLGISGWVKWIIPGPFMHAGLESLTCLAYILGTFVWKLKMCFHKNQQASSIHELGAFWPLKLDEPQWMHQHIFRPSN
jgi:hypothetical protein